MAYYQVLISAENRSQATKILDTLLEKKLILGGPILEGPAKFWWKGKIVNLDYVYLVTYTKENLKDEVTKVAEAASAEEVCMISYLPFEGNKKLLELIDKTL